MYTLLSIFLIIAGFVLGLGAVTVIDLHGFLGRKSSYWTEATTRTHKVTKPLIWFGIFLCLVGSYLFYSHVSLPMDLWFAPVAHFCLALLLILNGLFLSFSVSPMLIKKEKEGRSDELLERSWQNKIMISLLFSDIGWWGSLLLFAYVITRLI